MNTGTILATFYEPLKYVETVAGEQVAFYQKTRSRGRRFSVRAISLICN